VRRAEPPGPGTRPARSRDEAKDSRRSCLELAALAAPGPACSRSASAGAAMARKPGPAKRAARSPRPGWPPDPAPDRAARRVGGEAAPRRATAETPVAAAAGAEGPWRTGAGQQAPMPRATADGPQGSTRTTAAGLPARTRRTANPTVLRMRIPRAP